MTTKFAEPLAASQTTHVADMPPLEVVTEGIPQKEHIESAPAAQPRPVAREGWDRRWALALAGVMGLLLAVAGLFAYLQNSSTVGPGVPFVPPPGSGGAQPGAAAGYLGPLEGPALPYLQGWSIPSIAPIADVSIAPIAAISPISIPSIPDMAIPDVSIPDMAIPDVSIPDMALPSFPSTPSTPWPGFPSITFPSIPSIPSISVESIAPFPEISIAPFPEISIPPVTSITVPQFTDM